MTFMTLCHLILIRMSHVTFVALLHLSHMTFVPYYVCHICRLSHIWFLDVSLMTFVAVPFLIFEFKGRGRRLNYFSSPFQDDCPKRWEFLQENVESSAGVGSPERAL